MHTLLITIATSQHSTDLEIPAEVPIGDLMPKLLDLCGPQPPNAAQTQPSRWYLRLLDTPTPLIPTQSLLDAGVKDGAILVLQDTTAEAQPPQQKREEQLFTPQDMLPSKETGGIGITWGEKKY